MGAHKQEELYSYEEFVHIYLQDILKFHGSRFTTYSPSLQQQLRHLSFVAALINSRGQVQTVLEEHNIVKARMTSSVGSSPGRVWNISRGGR